MLSVTLLYVAIQIVAQGVLGPALRAPLAPLADAMARVHPALRGLMLAGAAVSMLGWVGSDLLGSPRILFALARDGFLPSALGRLHPATPPPRRDRVLRALVVVLALSGTFAELAVLSTLAVAPLYIAGCAASVRLARRGVRLEAAPLAFRGLGAAAAIGIVGMLVAIALASRAEIVGLAVLSVLIAIGVALRMTASARARAKAERG